MIVLFEENQEHARNARFCSNQIQSISDFSIGYYFFILQKLFFSLGLGFSLAHCDFLLIMEPLTYRLYFILSRFRNVIFLLS